MGTQRVQTELETQEKEELMSSQASAQGSAQKALVLTAALLLAFAVAFFLYYGLDTMNNPVFGIDIVPYHLAGRLLAEGNLEPLTNYTESGGFYAHSGPFLDYFHRHFYPQSTYATRWCICPPTSGSFAPWPASAFRWRRASGWRSTPC